VSRRVADHVAIIGLGLIGGSLARALTRAGYRVTGVDWPAVVRKARTARAISAGETRAEAVADADIVFLAAPPRTNLSLLKRLRPRLGPSTIVSDLGSVKGPICSLARQLRMERFVGGHPMAGSERSGFAASRPDLFRDSPWILTPDGSSPSAVRTVRGLVRRVGARPFSMAAEDHDRTVAFLSHMPQVASWAIAHAARTDAVAARGLAFAGPGFRDMTRLARSPRSLWREILGQSRREVSRAVQALLRALRRPV
jgi:prephenate dehydrogenase